MAMHLMDDIIDLELEKVELIISKIASDPEDDDVRRVELELWRKIKLSRASLWEVLASYIGSFGLFCSLFHFFSVSPEEYFWRKYIYGNICIDTCIIEFILLILSAVLSSLIIFVNYQRL